MADLPRGVLRFETREHAAVAAVGVARFSGQAVRRVKDARDDRPERIARENRFR